MKHVMYGASLLVGGVMVWQLAGAQPAPAAGGQSADNQAFQRQQFQQDAGAQPGNGAARAGAARAGGGRGGAGGAARVVQGEAGARFDLTGYWTAVVTEDWRWRMMTAPKGDFASVPLNDEGKKVGNEWTQAEDGSCKAYGVGNLMRMPTRVHITWDSPQVLKIESDWGEQTRQLYFRAADIPATAANTLQGESLARWEMPVPLGGVQGYRPPTSGGDLKVLTEHMAAGWLRRNGVPYSADAQVTEYFQTFTDPLGRDWFDVTTEVNDPTYLVRTFITSSDFRKEPDGSKWAPHPCKQ